MNKRERFKKNIGTCNTFAFFVVFFVLFWSLPLKGTPSDVASWHEDIDICKYFHLQALYDYSSNICATVVLFIYLSFSLFFFFAYCQVGLVFTSEDQTKTDSWWKLLLHMLTLFTTSWTQAARHKMAALTARFLWNLNVGC